MPIFQYAHPGSKLFIFLFLIVGLIDRLPVLAQIQLTGQVIDSASAKPLSYLNIGIRKKNVGTVSLEDGTFTLRIPASNQNDTLTFSGVGFAEQHYPVHILDPNKLLLVRMPQRVVPLAEVNVLGEKLVEKKFGIKRRNLLLHFTDGMFIQDDVFEIAQVIKLGDKAAQITSLNLHINAPRTDSALFRINFYQYENDRPGGRLVEKAIVQRHPIREGWLRFDLTEHQLWLRGTVVASLELLPEPRKDRRPIAYEIKLGGSSRSFYRRNSLGNWATPPHHYCLFVTARVDKNTPDEPDDREATPTATLASAYVKDTFMLFVRLPRDYVRNGTQKYPLVLHLDGNAYFYHVSRAVEQQKLGKLEVEPIVVGIGYSNAYVMDSLRNRDYTYPVAQPADSMPISGGGAKFYEFIQRELLPYLTQTYRIDPTNRTLMGHSFGGYFTLYALCRDLANGTPFANYVAASPPLSYGGDYLLNQFDGLPTPNNQFVKPTLLLTVGSLEKDQEAEAGYDRFKQSLNRFGNINVREYKNLDHMGTAVISFEEGVKLVSEKQ